MADNNFGKGVDELVEQAQKSRFGAKMPTPELEEKYETYNDYFADDEPITHSEREFNLATGNDKPVYEHLYKNKKNYMDRLAKGEDYGKMLGELKNLGTWSKGEDSWNPKNVRKEYFERLLGGFEDDGEQPKVEQKPMANQPKEMPKMEQPKLANQPKQPEPLTPDKSLEKYFNKPMKQSEWDENVYETDDGEEYLVATEDQAYEYAKDEIKNVWDDLGLESFTDNFREWILENAVDQDFVNQVLDEEIDYYEGEGEDDMVEYIKEVKEKGTGLDYLKELYGDRDFSKWLEEHDAIDLDKVADEAISWDGVAHFISSYDGKEHDLGNGLYAYRRN